MNDLPTISIITPSFNQAAYIEATLQSVLEQDYANLQYIVVDGESTDGTKDILERYRADIVATGGRLIIEPDDGQTSAINKGLELATGEVVGWLCSDDLLVENALDHVGRHFAEHPQSPWLAGACRMIDPQGRVLETRRPSGTFTIEGMLLRTGEHALEIAQPASFWRRSLHGRLGLLNESLGYCMDFDWWLRLVAAGARPTLTEQCLAEYRLHETSKSVAMKQGFFREHDMIERRYVQLIGGEARQRAQAMIDYRARLALSQAPRGRILLDLLRHPWWLASEDIRRGLLPAGVRERVRSAGPARQSRVAS